MEDLQPAGVERFLFLLPPDKSRIKGEIVKNFLKHTFSGMSRGKKSMGYLKTS